MDLRISDARIKVTLRIQGERDVLGKDHNTHEKEELF